MANRLRGVRPGILRAFLELEARHVGRPNVVLGLLALGACQSFSGPNAYPSAGTGGAVAAGSGGVAGSPAVSEGGFATGGTGGAVGDPVAGAAGGPEGFFDPVCPDAGLGVAPLSEQRLSNLTPATRTLYSWTVPEQVDELRQEKQLLIRSEQAGSGRGYAFDVIAQIAAQGRPEVSALAARFASELFPKIRYAWPNPWATRLGWPGEDYGNQLLRIVLRAEAWVVVVSAGTLRVVDMQNQAVALSDAMATPERIGAIFFAKDWSAGGPACNSSFVSGAQGYREFIVGNEAMIEEWSLGTPDILMRLAADIDALSEYLRKVRECGTNGYVLGSWNSSVSCAWSSESGLTPEPLPEAEYVNALALPSDYYFPSPDRLARLVDTLQSDLAAVPAPLVVRPGG